MKTRAIFAVAAVTFALTALPTSAHAQLVEVPVGGVPIVYAPGSGFAVYPRQIALPACQVVRQQFDDVYGWRVRDVLVCSPRQTSPGP
jgi:hypothetical protein